MHAATDSNMPLISAVCYSKLSYFIVYVYWEYICTCIQALHQYMKSHSATKDYNYMYLVRITFNDVSCLQ